MQETLSIQQKYIDSKSSINHKNKFYINITTNFKKAGFQKKKLSNALFYNLSWASIWIGPYPTITCSKLNLM